MSEEAKEQQASRAAGVRKKSTLATMCAYYGVSIMQSVVEFAVFALLGTFFSRQVANAAAIVCSATVQFLMNRNVTFKSSGNIVRSIVLFVLLWVWNLAFSTAAITWLPDMLGWNSLVVKLCCMCCQGVWGWLLSRYVIFK